VVGDLGNPRIATGAHVMNDEISPRRLFQARFESQQQPKQAGVQARRHALFGPPLLLEGEDGAAYDELLARIWAAVKPTDIIDEMFTVDIVSSEFEVLRWRRLKLSLIQKRAIEDLEEFLGEELHYDLYCDYFVDDLAEILEENLPEDQVNSAQALAQQCALNETNAVDKVTKVLAIAGLNLDKILQDAQDRKVKDLVQAYAQREPDAVTVIDELLRSAGTSINVLMAEALAKNLDYVERVDRLVTIAEGRRNASLHQIDRRRPLLAETLRRSVQRIESDELEVIGTASAKGENAA
jgi:hypothetical protein